MSPCFQGSCLLCSHPHSISVYVLWSIYASNTNVSHIQKLWTQRCGEATGFREPSGVPSETQVCNTRAPLSATNYFISFAASLLEWSNALCCKADEIYSQPQLGLPWGYTDGQGLIISALDMSYKYVQCSQFQSTSWSDLKVKCIICLLPAGVRRAGLALPRSAKTLGNFNIKTQLRNRSFWNTEQERMKSQPTSKGKNSTGPAYITVCVYVYINTHAHIQLISRISWETDKAQIWWNNILKVRKL